jgi:ABC-type lipoprotein release transport system permease subunit
MGLFLRLAWRNIWRHRRRTVIVVLAIGLTLAMMMFYDGLVAGFEESIYSNAIKVLGGNIQIHAAGYSDKAQQTPLLPLANDQAVLDAVLKQPQVVAASRRINTGGLASDYKGAFAVGITGIEPEKEQSANLIAQHVSAGRYLNASDKEVLFIGKGLADAMGVTVGDRITLAGRATHNQMASRTMTVIGIFDIGMADVEKRTVYMSLAEAQDIYGLAEQSTEVVVYLKRIGQEPAVMNALKPGLPGYEMASWQTNYPDLQNAIQTKGAFMSMFSYIIMFVVGIGILNLLLMAVYERTREIGVMSALGLRPGQISVLFVLEGAFMGLVGVAFGVLLGVLLNAGLGQVGMDFSAFTSMSEYTALITGKIYPTLGFEKLLEHALVVLFIAILASLYPATEAAQKEPAASLHYV